MSVRRFAVEHDFAVAQEAQAVEVPVGRGDAPDRGVGEVHDHVDLRVCEEPHEGPGCEQRFRLPGEASRYRATRDEVHVRKPGLVPRVMIFFDRYRFLISRLHGLQGALKVQALELLHGDCNVHQARTGRGLGQARHSKHAGSLQARSQVATEW